MSKTFFCPPPSPSHFQEWDEEAPTSVLLLLSLCLFLWLSTDVEGKEDEIGYNSDIHLKMYYIVKEGCTQTFYEFG